MSTLDQRLRARRSLRLRAYDYSSAGAYFVTVCVRGRQLRLGEIVDGEARLWMEGQMVREVWEGLEDRVSTVGTDAFVVMPNHVHGIVVIQAGTGSPPSDLVVVEATGAMNHAPTPASLDSTVGVERAPTLGEVVRVFKAVSTRWIREVGDPEFGWQRNYYELVIRNEREMERARAYIAGNPARWAEDADNPRVPR